MNINQQVEANKDRFLNELIQLLKIPSVSADSAHKKDVHLAAEFLVNQFQSLGLTTELHETPGHPIVYAEKMVDPKQPTVLVYGHYDVQPPDPLSLWESPPFEPVIKDGRIFARGACDDKGQMYMHVKALEVLQASGEIPCNVKLMIEGEEEVGSDNLEVFVKSHRDKLACDVVIISDTAMISNENPSITVSLRGLSYLEVEITGPNRDLHSGVYGGAVANPINVLCSMIASLQDDSGRITIPGFYDKVAEYSDSERAALAEIPFDLGQYKKLLDIEEVHGEAGYTTIERTGIRPSLDVNGIWGGYTGEGAKTVLPSKAYAKLSTRLVANQNNEEITELIKRHLETIAPAAVKVAVRPHHGGEPASVSTKSVAYEAASKAYEQVWGKVPLATREGGSIPIVSLFQNELKTDPILMGFGLNEDAIHSPNESYGVENYLKGIETIANFYRFYTI